MPDRDVGFAENDNRQSGPVQGVAHRRAGAAVSRPGLVPPCEESAPLRAYVCTRAHGVRKWPYMWLAQRFPCDTIFTYGVASPIAIPLSPALATPHSSRALLHLSSCPRHQPRHQRRIRRFTQSTCLLGANIKFWDRIMLLLVGPSLNTSQAVHSNDMHIGTSR
jgi:hypothetical protein